jgi:hypothetical protein
MSRWQVIVAPGDHEHDVRTQLCGGDEWKELLNGDCLRRDAHSLQERCDLVCPDLPKVL